MKWNLPFGVIFDSLVKDHLDLPICVTVHFKHFPETSVLKYKGIESFRFYYLNSIKEACTIMLGSSKEILNLSTKDTNRLLEIAQFPQKKNKEFLELYNKIFENLLSNVFNSNDFDKNTKYLFPIKFVFNNNDIVLTKPYDVQEHGLDCTLLEYISKVFEYKAAESIIKNINNKVCKLYIASIQFDLMTPIAFIVLNFSYLDCFTYIVINEH